MATRLRCSWFVMLLAFIDSLALYDMQDRVQRRYMTVMTAFNP